MRISVQTGRYASLVFVYIQFIVFLVTPSWTGTSAKGATPRTAGTYWTGAGTHASTSSTASTASTSSTACAASAANTAASAAPG